VGTTGLPVGLHVLAVCSRRDTQPTMTILVALGRFLASKDKYVRDYCRVEEQNVTNFNRLIFSVLALILNIRKVSFQACMEASWLSAANVPFEHCHRTPIWGLIFWLEHGKLKALLGRCEGVVASISSRNRLFIDNAKKNWRAEKLLTICPKFVKIEAPHEGR
jgi:hypothetical protein